MDDLKKAVNAPERLINANELMEWLQSKIRECVFLNAHAEAATTEEIIRYVKHMPAVDAAPVVHGRWLGRQYDFKEYKYVIVPYDETTFNNPDDLFCSVCNTPALSNGAENDVPSNYCPNCGAKMDEEG